MKSRNILWIVLTLAAFCFMSCFSLFNKKKSDPVPVRYSFAENNSNTATITFIQGSKKGVMLVDCDGVSRPAPAEGTYWERDNLFPAGIPLDIRVYVYWNENRYGERRRGIFRCPPLETGKSYKLWFKGNSRGGSLILTDVSVIGVDLPLVKSIVDVVYEQKIPPPPSKKKK
jgi:hypothetical protein